MIIETMRVPNIALFLLVLVGCAPRPTPRRASTHYVPRARAVAIPPVPLLVKELAKPYPFLEKDFAPGGVLAGKEVFAFSPSTVTAVAGDTLHLMLINP